MTNYTLLTKLRADQYRITYTNKHGDVCTEYQDSLSYADRYVQWLVRTDGARHATVWYKHHRIRTLPG
jgi:hypothetical protein